MSMPIIHEFETIEVEEEDGQRIAVARCALDLVVGGREQVARVVDARDVVDERPLLRMVVTPLLC